MTSPDSSRFAPLPDPDDDLPVDALGQPLDPGDDESPQGALGRFAFREGLQVPLLTLAAFGVLSLVVAVLYGVDLRAAAPTEEAPAEAAQAAVTPMNPSDPYTFSGLDIHPDRLYGRYFAGAFSQAVVAADDSASHLNGFRWRLDMYRKAYGVDDNFSVRVLDERTGQTLEVAQLRAQKDRFNGTGQASWDDVNRERRDLTTQLRRKWEAYGVPRDAIVIRWGYANQTAEARDRDERYITYEVNLARRLGLSVLATEIGTVETFNQDQLVSSAGARSRYQMMPDILRMFDVVSYPLQTSGGATVQVREELHPLLSAEPALMLVRAYANSVGHELPGISAYHTGPGNIFRLYREYLRSNPGLVQSERKHVSDAYMWGVTDGFDRVDAVSSFGPESRAYVLKAYGSLRATENQLIDPTTTIHAERVRIRPGASVTLDELLTALEPHERRLNWGPVRGATIYEKFRDLNPHISLPVASGAGVPANGNLRLASTSENKPVRFFLPEGAASVLRRVGLDVLGNVEPFDESTFLLDPEEVTPVDEAYARLVRDAGMFGFTRSAQRRLAQIHDQLQELAAANPDSRYRQTQAKIARIHRSVWQTRAFDDLVATTETLLSVDPRIKLGREPVADASGDSASMLRRQGRMETVPARPPRIEDTVNY